jgi:flagellin-like hook-associated protein FlgL
MPPWHEPFPAGNGTLATITFKTIYQPTESADMAFGSLKLYNTKLIDENVEQIPYSLTHGEFQIVPVTFRPIDIQVETGVIRFSGEIADFYISITDYGFAINPEMINATLYFNGTVYADLSMMLKSVSKGLYRIVYEIPADAKTGTYVLLVETEYLQVHGTSIKSFQISSTLTGWDAQITETNNNIATIIIPSLDQIKANLTSINANLIDISGTIGTIQTSIGIINANLTAINAKLVSINGTVATIDSTVGSIQTSVEAIRLKVVDIDWETRIANIQTSLGAIKGYVMDVDDGGLATINTELGTVKTKVMDTAENVGTSTVLLYVILVLALIAAVVSIISMVYPRKKLT